jgi:hypothetical protein
VGGLKSYDVDVNGFKTSLRLSDADAKARGLLKDKPAKPAVKPPAEPAVKPPAEPAAKEAAAPQNKSRTSAPNK